MTRLKWGKGEVAVVAEPDGMRDPGPDYPPPPKKGAAK